MKTSSQITVRVYRGLGDVRDAPQQTSTATYPTPS